MPEKKSKSKLKSFARVIILFLFIFFINCSSIFANNQKYFEHLYLGSACFNLGKFDQAIHEYTLAEKIYPESKIAILNKALIYKNIRQYKNAISYYKKLLKIDPDKIIYRNLGQAYYLSSSFDDAITCFEKALRLGHQEPMVFYWMGKAYQQKKSLDEAMVNFKQAVLQDDTFALAHLALGRIYMEKEQWVQAQKELEKVQKFEPSITEIYAWLGLIYLKQKKYEDSLKIYRKAKNIYPDDQNIEKAITQLYAQAPDGFQKAQTKKQQQRFQEEKTKLLKAKIAEGAPLVKVYLMSSNKLHFKCASKFVIKSVQNKKELYQGEKDELFSLSYKQGRGRFHKQEQEIFNFNESLAIIPEDKDATILIFNVEAGKGEYWASETDRIYRGEIRILLDDDNLFSVVNVINMEEYLYGVLPSEMPSDWPLEALKAQAVAARSEAFYKMNRHKAQGFDFCAGVHCQAYGGAKMETALSIQAVDQTCGEIAVYENKPIDAVYSNSCGGHTQGNIFGTRKGIPYLQDREDAFIQTGFNFPLSAYELEDWLWNQKIPVFCNNERFSRCSNFRWMRLYTKEQLEVIINKNYQIGELTSIDILERNPSSHIHRILIKGSNSEFEIEKELNIRQALGNLRSGMFNIDVQLDKRGRPVEFLFYGGGWGHGVGMCQVGAATMAEQGFDYSEILKFYYTDISIKKMY
ncbi:MAG: SpoIID/LytB domain-containing protein [Candidatus Omnitrophota bacterium]